MPQQPATNWLVFGCGYLGGRVAQRWRTAGGQVYATTRQLGKADELCQRGIVPIVGNITDGQALPVLPDQSFDGVLFAVGRDGSSGQSHRDVFLGGLMQAWKLVSDRCRWFGYVSSTGVYGDAAGAWIDEDSPTVPDSPGGAACLEAEHYLRDAAGAVPYSVFRMGGLYGPGRVPRQRDVAAGAPLAVPAVGFLNLIHVDDAAWIVDLVARHEVPPRLLCVTDGNPVRRREYLSEIARRIGGDAPVFTDPTPGTPRQRGDANKRVSNQRLKHLLQYAFQYPSYREGLAAALKLPHGLS